MAGRKDGAVERERGFFSKGVAEGAMADNSFSNPEMGVAVNSVRASGGGALTGFTLPKLLWVRDNEPRNFERVRKSA